MEERSEGVKRKTNEKTDASKKKAKYYAWINQAIVDKLKNDWDMIDVKKEGKNSFIRLTKKGENFLKDL